jgi:hypothetical protein
MKATASISLSAAKDHYMNAKCVTDITRAVAPRPIFQYLSVRRRAIGTAVKNQFVFPKQGENRINTLFVPVERQKGTHASAFQYRGFMLVDFASEDAPA